MKEREKGEEMEGGKEDGRKERRQEGKGRMGEKGGKKLRNTMPSLKFISSEGVSVIGERYG